MSSKFAICGLPVTLDLYKGCPFGCVYCFANFRRIMPLSSVNTLGCIDSIKRRLDRIFNRGEVSSSSLLDNLIADGITWHCGGLSDPFQPREKAHRLVEQMLSITNEYGISILFSTKADTVHGNLNLDPSVHAFQLSITNLNNNTSIEPNVPSIERRYTFFQQLKDAGFRVGIRIQPFIPGITTTEIIDRFHEADYFTIEGLKLVPQDKEQRRLVTQLTNLSERDFIQMGLLNLKPHIRLRVYQPFINKLEEMGLPYSIADNDLHHMTKSKCCCGEPLVTRSTDFNNTAMFYKYGDFGIGEIEAELGVYADCRAYHLFASNRKEGCHTVLDFYRKRFNRATSPFSTQFMYAHREQGQQLLEVD